MERMAEQPSVLERLIARGSSDHASVVGRYLLELATRRPAGLRKVTET
jgi:hypothetical protein